MDFAAKFPTGLRYDDFLETHGSNEHRQRWQTLYERVSLSDAQKQLLHGFSRDLNVLCMAGTWCGDCVEQCPIFRHFEQECARITVRYFDRDAHPDLQAELSICGGARVPAIVFLSEDLDPLGRHGDRTLAKYRHMAATQLGPACPTGIGGPPDDLLAAVVQDWLNEFERMQLMVRLSPRLRKKHGD